MTLTYNLRSIDFVIILQIVHLSASVLVGSVSSLNTSALHTVTFGDHDMYISCSSDFHNAVSKIACLKAKRGLCDSTPSGASQPSVEFLFIIM